MRRLRSDQHRRATRLFAEWNNRSCAAAEPWWRYINESEFGEVIADCETLSDTEIIDTVENRARAEYRDDHHG